MLHFSAARAPSSRSMAVLGCVRPNIIIGEWRCVEKTFSDYWDVLRNLGVEVLGAQEVTEAAGAQRRVLEKRLLLCNFNVTDL